LGVEAVRKAQQKSEEKYQEADYFARKEAVVQAVEALKASILLNQRNAEAHLLLGKLRERQDKLKLAIRHYSAYISIQPSDERVASVRNKIKKLTAQINE
jgi:regulator of sirC expression with transglutaminase-like and TPR domain